MADQTPPPISSSPPPTPAPRTEPLAIWSLILAALSFFCGWLFTAIPAVICGHIARSKIRKSGGAVGGMGIATAGLIVGYIGVAIGLLGIPLLVSMVQSERERLHRLKIEEKEIASDDGKLKVTTSGMWAKMSDLNKRAALQAGNKSSDMYVMVFTDPKSTLGNMSLAQHHQLTRDRILQKMENSSATQPSSLTIDGHPALQDELSGKEQKADLVFLHTTIDEGDAYQQILAWTTKSRWPKQNQELREATNTFHAEK
jgi:Domain of unknown function (DUF4190)